MPLMVASISASLPPRESSMTRFTAATSGGGVLDDDATANGPDAGRTSGLNCALALTRLPRNPTPAWAKAEFATAGFGPGRFVGVGAAALPIVVVLGVTARGVACAACGALSGRLRGNGTVVAATAVVATSAVAAIKARVGIRCFRKPSAPRLR